MGFSIIAHTAGRLGLSPAIGTTGADLLVAVVAGYSGFFTGVSDSKGNTWTGLTTRSSGSLCRIWYVVSPSVGSGHTFNAGTSGAPCSVAVLAFSGVDTGSPFDAENGAGSSAGVSSLATGSVTPANSGSLVIAGVGYYPSGGVSINGGFTISDQVDYASGGGGQMGVGGAYLIQGAVAAANPTWTHGSTFTEVAAAIAVFKAAAGGGGGSAVGADALQIYLRNIAHAGAY